MNTLEKMQNNPNVRVKETLPGVFACNFTRKAFYNGHWDDQTVKARGLFLDENGNVLARGFEKFFNLDEPGQQTTEEFLDSCEFPVMSSVKHNGYLCVISVIDGKLVFLSKSGVTDYSRHAEKMFYSVASDSCISSLIQALNECNASLLVEVVDNLHDPHIVPSIGPSTGLFALALVKNQEEFQLLDTYTLQEITSTRALRASAFSPIPVMFTPPEVLFTREDLEHEIEVSMLDTRTEGVVLTDASGHMVKVKSNPYRAIKSVRTSLNKILSGKDLTASPRDKTALEVAKMLRKSDKSLKDYLVVSITGQPVLDIPSIVEDVGYKVFTDC